MDISYLYEFPIWVKALIIFAILLAAMGVGYEVGKRRRLATTACDASEGSDVALASVLALLGLVLAFTCFFTLSRGMWCKGGRYVQRYPNRPRPRR